MSTEHKIVVFANVIFEQHGNQSVKNFIEGLLQKNHKVMFLTVHPQESDSMREFMSHNPNFTVKYLQVKESLVKVAKHKSSLKQGLKRSIKRMLGYRKLASNSEINQWFSLLNTYKILRRIGSYITNGDISKLLLDSEKIVFIDVFGGIVSKYIRLVYPEIWNRIEHKTVGYYLGTVMKQFRGNKIFAFLGMPISFFGSYKLPSKRLIITDDGTDGEQVFKNMMEYKDSVLFIRNGIDDQLYKYELATTKTINLASTLLFVTSSRLTRWKRIDRAIKFVYLISRLTNHIVHLTIIGEGEERESLENLVAKLRFANHVTFTGGLEYQKALDQITKNSFYIICNELSNLGNQVFEGIMLELIPLTIDDGSTDSLLRNGYNSIKFPMCADFERNAARIFVSWLDDHNLHMLKQNLCETKSHVFTWRERNRFEHDFMFGDVQAEAGIL
ncbi:MAG: glycosyltransferase [Anaerolineaceae bacterium]|nr:MAG: glycosyltransferase [Anaerolineaceae bacterium]